MWPFARSLALFVVAGLPACTIDTPVAVQQDPSHATSSRSVYSSWTSALDIEAAVPGAHSSFNLPGSLEGCPFISADGKTFYMASNRPGGKGGIDIWISTRASVDELWSQPVNPGEPVNSSADDFCPTIARDLHTLYFVSKRQVGAQGVAWCGGSDIYVTRRRDDGTYDTPRNVGCSVNSASDEFSPFPMEEQGIGPVLYFSSTRPGFGSGGNLYRSLSHGGVFGPPALVPGVNSVVDDGQPNISRDGLELYFYSARTDLPGAQGGNDLYVATRGSAFEPWSIPVNLGASVNSSASETRPSLSWDGTTLYFGTTRAGSSDVYVTSRRKLVMP